MQPHERVLIVLLKTPKDGTIAREQHWYRLPLKHGPRDIAAEWIAFYQPGAFGQDRWGIYSYARIRQTHIVRRIDLFPHESAHPRAQQHYYVISFEPPVRLAQPLLSDRGRRVLWTETTWWRFTAAHSLDELFSPEPLPPAERDQVLVGILPKVRDFGILTREHWYRIPRALVQNWVTPGYLAFYFGQAFGEEAGLIRYYAAVQHADVVKRLDLFPGQVRHPRAQMDYIRVHLDELSQRPAPIRSRHPRRIVLLPTTWERFVMASDLNDLAAGDPDDDALYGRLTGEGLRPERSYYVRGANAYYFTDFAFLCRKGNVQVDVEPSESSSHRLYVARPDGIAQPADGWTALRLSRFDITRRQEESVRQIRGLVDASGGMITA